MGHPARRVVVLLLTAGALALSGCTGVADATKYYMLSPSPAAPADSAHTAVSGLSVGVGPVLIPRYLERAQIVTRGTNDEVEISEYRRWAEPLESGIAQVLADNLAAQVGSERVAVFPWRGATALGRSITAWSSWCCGSMAPPAAGSRSTCAGTSSTRPERSSC